MKHIAIFGLEKVSKPSLWVRESSPDITVEKVAESPLFSSISFCKSPSKHPKIVSTQKYQEENVSNSKSYQINKSQSSLSSVCQNDLFLEPVQKTIPRGIGGTFFYDEQPASFKAMDERRMLIFIEPCIETMILLSLYKIFIKLVLTYLY